MSPNGRILTTHVGSLPRSQAVTDVLFARDRGDALDEEAANATIASAVQEVVRRQVDVGIDVVSDGEMSKISYATYIKDRLTGFAGDTPREPGQDLVEFPRILKRLAETGATAKYARPRCVGDIRVKSTLPLRTDLDNMKAATQAAAPADAFLNAASPGVIALFQPNEHYRTQDEYLEAVAQAMQAFYQLPYETFEKWSPHGTVDDLAEFVAPYVDAGCHEFNLLICGADVDVEIDAVARIKQLVGG